MDVADDDALKAAKAFRAGPGPIAIAVLANVVLAALCLGVPYYRGHLQAKASLRAFARFATCLLDAQVKTELGLGMPVGEREHFAAQMMRGPRDWPGRCTKKLHEIAPPEAIFLWPSVKQANGDVRAGTRLLETELRALTQKRATQPGRVPARPLLALATLRSTLALMAKAANAEDELDRDAIAFHKPPLLAEPARLPIVAGSSAALDVWAGQDGLTAVALDGRGVSFLHVEGGQIDHHRFRRTSQVRAALRFADQPWIVWATSRTRCEQDENKCVRRATGLARLQPGAEQLPLPIWLSGHPAGRVDRSLRFLVEDRIDLLARADAEGTLEVRRFKLERTTPTEPVSENPAPANPPDAGAGAAPARTDTHPLAPLERFAVPAADPPIDALLLPGSLASVAYAVATQGGLDVWLSRYEKAEAPVALGELSGTGAFIQACEAQGAIYVAFGTASELSVSRLADDGAVSALLSRAPIALGDVLHPEDRAHDRSRLLCRGEQAMLVAATRDERALFVLRCDQEYCERGPELARDVAAFDATVVDNATLIAYSRSAAPELMVLRLDPQGRPLEAAVTPAACWDPPSGMCGQPTLVADDKRLLLCARDGSDLLALESEDGGHAWKPMSGLKVSGAINTDASAPMQQHRKRKGLD